MSADTLIFVVAGLAIVFYLLPRLLGMRGAGPDVVRQKLAAGAVVVDVRSPGEFRSGAYPGALNIPIQELRARVSQIPRGRPVVVYCASGARSGMAVGQLKQAGFEDVVNAGGLHAMPR